MAAIKEQALKIALEVCEPGRRVVWGEGRLNAAVAIVGEAPGDKEDRLGRPFVGPAGTLLERELAGVGLSRNEVWITNVVKCRPTKLEAGRAANRPPTAREVRAWAGLLMEELRIISPRVIVCAGAPAAKALIRKDFALTQERGRWFEGPFGSRIMATYHPAYILRRTGPSYDDAIAEFRSDLHEVRKALRHEAAPADSR